MEALLSARARSTYFIEPLYLGWCQGAVVESEFIDPAGKPSALFVRGSHADVSPPLLEHMWSLRNRHAPHQRTVNVQRELAAIRHHSVVSPNSSNYQTCCAAYRLPWRNITNDFQIDLIIQRLKQTVARTSFSACTFKNRHLALKRIEFDK